MKPQGDRNPWSQISYTSMRLGPYEARTRGFIFRWGFRMPDDSSAAQHNVACFWKIISTLFPSCSFASVVAEISGITEHLKTELKLAA